MFKQHKRNFKFEISTSCSRKNLEQSSCSQRAYYKTNAFLNHFVKACLIPSKLPNQHLFETGEYSFGNNLLLNG